MKQISAISFKRESIVSLKRIYKSYAKRAFLHLRRRYHFYFSVIWRCFYGRLITKQWLTHVSCFVPHLPLLATCWTRPKSLFSRSITPYSRLFISIGFNWYLLSSCGTEMTHVLQVDLVPGVCWARARVFGLGRRLCEVGEGAWCVTLPDGLFQGCNIII
jgi:hypothetical protein